MAIGKIIVVANQKGGVAKTSTVRNLSYALAEMGSRVLTVDFDPQANLSVSFGVIPSGVQCSTGHLMLKVLMGEALPDKETYIQTIGKIDLIPASKSLTVAEVNLLIEPDSDESLKTVLAPLRAFYDYIIVDTGPSLGSLTINAFTAADEIIIPIDPELFAVVGLNDLTGTIGKIKQRLNPGVEIGGILLTKCQKRTRLFRKTNQQVHELFSHLRIFESVIPLTVEVGTANASGLSVMEQDPTNAAGIAYLNLAKEVAAHA